MATNNPLYQPVKLGNLTLKNRMVMSPMTRNRATPQNIPGLLAPEYYRQRSSAGLIITEATQVHPKGVGYPLTPGIHNEEQVEGWKKVTQAVHEEGSKIFLQLWHVGRISHSDFHGGDLPVAPSAIKPNTQIITYSGLKDPETPRALETDEIPEIVAQFKHGAQLAKNAGFDGVEIHAANGYLIDQFLQDGTNHRSDQYGGNIENRSRFLLEVTDAVLEVWNHDRVGVRLSINSDFNDMHETQPEILFPYVASQLNKRNLLFIDVVENYKIPAADENKEIRPITKKIKQQFSNYLLVNGGYNKARAEHVIANQEADLVVFGKPFLANPDLPKRFIKNAPLNEPDKESFYGGDHKGYTDYPFLEEMVSQD